MIVPLTIYVWMEETRTLTADLTLLEHGIDARDDMRKEPGCIVAALQSGEEMIRTLHLDVWISSFAFVTL